MEPKAMQKHIKNQCKNWYRQNQEFHGHLTFRKCKTNKIRRKGHRISRFRKVRARTGIHLKYMKHQSKIHPKIDIQMDEKQGVKTMQQRYGKGGCGSKESYHAPILVGPPNTSRAPQSHANASQARPFHARRDAIAIQHKRQWQGEETTAWSRPVAQSAVADLYIYIYIYYLYIVWGHSPE
jgi:hypothetical protein